MCLHHSRLSVEVYYKAGQIIAFAMNQAEGCILWIIRKSDGFANIYGGLYATDPEVAVNGLILEGKHTNGNAPYLPMSYGYERAVEGKHSHEVALLHFAIYVVDCAREDPRMVASQTLVLSFIQIQVLHPQSVASYCRS